LDDGDCGSRPTSVRILNVNLIALFMHHTASELRSYRKSEIAHVTVEDRCTSCSKTKNCNEYNDTHIFTKIYLEGCFASSYRLSI